MWAEEENEKEKINGKRNFLQFLNAGIFGIFFFRQSPYLVCAKEKKGRRKIERNIRTLFFGFSISLGKFGFSYHCEIKEGCQHWGRHMSRCYQNEGCPRDIFA